MQHLLIFWKITSINRKKKRKIINHNEITTEDTSIDKSKRDERIFDKNLFIYTDYLSDEQNIMIDIAVRRKELLNDDSFFIPLRHLFKTYSNDALNNCNYLKMICISLLDYHEDEEDKYLSEREFIEIISGVDNLIQLHNGIYAPNRIKSKDEHGVIIPELTEIKIGDFELTENDINILNIFVKGAFHLRQTPIINEPKTYSLIAKPNLSLVKHISDGQLQSSLVEFRKLFMEEEPANFYKTLKILTDKRKIHHPIVEIFNDFRKQYNVYLGKISSLYFFKTILSNVNISVNDINDNVTGKNIINSILYTGIIHQGKAENYNLRNLLEVQLKSSAMLFFIFDFLIKNISNIYINSANYISYILYKIQSLKTLSPSKTISAKEKQFINFVINKSYELAEIMWKNSNCPPQGVLFYKNNALKQIESIFDVKFYQET